MAKFRFRLILLVFVVVSTVTYLFYATGNESNVVPQDIPSAQSNTNKKNSELGSISRIIHQTYRTASVEQWALESGRDNRTSWFLSWELKNNGYKHSVLDDAAADAFMKSNFDSRTYEAYKRMPLPVLRADLLRYAMIYIHGGVYTDSDTECHKAVDSWAGRYSKETEFLASIEWYKDSHNFDIPMYKKTQLVQWTFAAAPRHPIFKNTIADIVQKVEKLSLKHLGDKNNVEALGGPQVFTRHVLEYMAGNGDDLEQLGQKDDTSDRIYFEKSRVLLLPMFSFMAQLAVSFVL
ncbi:UNVERIFIED_CONTAM: hypothetical protein HDU68_003024 [Siphonaria sp. JEL0065]|nr:hypothetical protein HDU68_003024 [Siphonaria sp. JEL0065]